MTYTVVVSINAPLRSYRFEYETEEEAMTTLEKLLESGSITVWCGEYIGTASDGVEVILGAIGKEDVLESYLLSHPTPESW